MDIRLDEFVTLYVRAMNPAEARGRGQAMAASIMPGHHVVTMPELVEARREPEFCDLFEMTVYPAPVNL